MNLGIPLQEHERHLWKVCYRMTGSAADADDLVQETFARALAQPVLHLAAPRAWLTRIAVNLARDLLRKRKRTESGLPLPSPEETEDELAPGGDVRATAEHRYEVLESVSLAFRVAMEALTPRQRAVLVLRDALEYSVRETAAALDISEDNVRTIHRRAHAAMRAREGRHAERRLQQRDRAALQEYIATLLSETRKDTDAAPRLCLVA